jgi:hypothetical protein
VAFGKERITGGLVYGGYANEYLWRFKDFILPLCFLQKAFISTLSKVHIMINTFTVVSANYFFLSNITNATTNFFKTPYTLCPQRQLFYGYIIAGFFVFFFFLMLYVF